MPGTILITRPKKDAEALAAILSKKGFNCIVEPILAIKLYNHKTPLKKALEKKPQAIIATSKHAISAMAAITKVRSVPIVAIGPVSARHAVKLGFRHVATADGDATSLIAFIRKNYSPDKGGLLYIRGEEVSADIAEQLIKSRFAVNSVTLYKAEKIDKLSVRTCKAITEHKVDSVLFFSQNTVRTYAKLTRASNLSKIHNKITALCLSSAIAKEAKKLLPWKKVALFPPHLKEDIAF